MPEIAEHPSEMDVPDPAYLDNFLQGARFALFALEGRLRDSGREVPPELAQALEEFHRLYESTRSGLDAREARIELIARYMGKN